MKKQLIALGIVGSMLGAPAYASDEPLSFKVKYAVKTLVLWAPRSVRFVIVYHAGPVEALLAPMVCERVNYRCRGQGWEDFKFFSWGD